MVNLLHSSIDEENERRVVPVISEMFDNNTAVDTVDVVDIG